MRFVAFLRLDFEVVEFREMKPTIVPPNFAGGKKKKKGKKGKGKGKKGGKKGGKKKKK